MNIDFYSKDQCGYCTMAQNYMDRKGIPYNKFKLGENLTLEEFKEKWPDVSYMPHFVVDGEPVSDYRSFLENLDNA
jgi:glutaredoxin